MGARSGPCLVRLPAYAVNQTKRLIKTPELFWSDTALALHLAGEPGPHDTALPGLLVHGGEEMAWLADGILTWARRQAVERGDPAQVWAAWVLVGDAR